MDSAAWLILAVVVLSMSFLIIIVLGIAAQAGKELDECELELQRCKQVFQDDQQRKENPDD